MQLYTVHAEHFKLDGGASFGVVPKSLWSKNYPADENNMVVFALRCLLVQEDKKLILFDTGVGNKQNEKFLNNFYISGHENLLNAIRELGFSPEDITDIVFTHLHFDHCGGAFLKNDKGEVYPAFPNAKYWCSEAQWKWAVNPNAREKASFLLENLLPIEQSGKLNFIEQEQQFTPNIYLKIFGGHTDGQIIPFISYNGKTIVYMADFIPTAAHIPLAYIPAFDTRPLLSLDEKQEFLKQAADNNYILLFQHDAVNECCTVHHTDKGVRVKEMGTLEYFCQ